MSGSNGIQPPGRRETTLGDIGEVIRGVTYKKEQARNEPAGGFLPLLRATNIGEQLNFDELVYVPETVVKSEKLLRRGDVVIAASSGSIRVVGKAALLRQNWEGTFGAFCSVFRPGPEADPGFIALFMTSPAYRARISSLAAGININNLKREHILETPVSLPPLEEQRAIVERTDDLTRRVRVGSDLLKSALRDVAVLEEALRYRSLSVGDDAVEPAAIVARLTQLEAQRVEAFERRKAAGKARGRYKPPVDVLDPPDCPAGWPMRSLDSVCELVTDGDHNPPPRQPEGIPHLTAQHVVGGALSFENATYISQDDFETVKQRWEPQRDDVVVTCVGTIGRVAVVPPNCRTFSPDRNLSGCRPLPGMDSRFLYHVLSSPVLQERMQVASGWTAQPHVYLAELRQLPVPVPPLNVQRAIAHDLDVQLEQMANMARALRRALEQADVLRASLVHEAFAERASAQAAGGGAATSPGSAPSAGESGSTRTERAVIGREYT